MLGYYLLVKKKPKNIYLRWLLVMLWDMAGAFFGIWIFFIRTISSKTYNMASTAGWMGFALMLLTLAVYNGHYRGGRFKECPKCHKKGFYMPKSTVIGGHILYYNKTCRYCQYIKGGAVIRGEGLV